jgi:hypothetical protein
MEAERGSASIAMDDDDYIAIGHFGMAYMLVQAMHSTLDFFTLVLLFFFFNPCT